LTASGIVELREEYKAPGLETELSGIYPHLTDNNLYYVITNGKPQYKPTMKPMLPETFRNKLLTVNRDGKVVKVMELPDGGGLFGDLKYGDGYMWLGPLDPPMLWKLDLNSGHVVARYPLPGPAGGMDFDPSSHLVYVQSYVGHPHLAVVDARTGVVVRSLWSDENCQGMARVDGDMLTVWTSSWEQDAYTELWHLDEQTGRPKMRLRLDGVHAAMAPLDPNVAGYSGFMTLMHKGSAVSGETVIRRYRYVSERKRPASQPRRERADAVAAIQYLPVRGRPEANRAELSKLIQEAAGKGATYVTLPELSLLGAMSADSVKSSDHFAEPIPGPSTEYFGALAARFGVWIALSLAETTEQGNGYYITSVLLDAEGHIQSTTRKRMLRPISQDGKATAGFVRWLMDTTDDAGRRVAVISGDDLQSGVPRLADRGADTIFVNGNWSPQDAVPWVNVATELAERYNVRIVVANQDPSLGGIFERGKRVTPGKSGNAAVMVFAKIDSPDSQWTVPSSLGLPSVPVPRYLAFSPAVVELGRELFFDPKLSSTGAVSCATCHIPDHFFGDERPRGVGVYDRRTGRNTPTLLNSAFKTTLHWDGNPTTLEQQIKYPLGGFAEMNLRSSDVLIEYLRSRPDYVAVFRAAMNVEPQNIGREHLAHALASYERTLISANSAFDRYYYQGEKDALGVPARRGLDLFIGKAGCANCHRITKNFALFLDGRFHTLGIGYVPESKAYLDAGVGIVSSSDYEGMFFTPSLRDVAETAPYMHDGSITTLEAAVRVHFRPPISDVAIPHVKLSEAEVGDLVSFLRSLTGAERYSKAGIRTSELPAMQSKPGASAR